MRGFMKRINWQEIASKCFSQAEKKEMHVNDMAETAIQYGIIKGMPVEEIASKLSSSLSSNSKNKTAVFKRVKNKKGGFRKGVYRYKPAPAPQLVLFQAPNVSTNFTGKAGEHAVLSELLFRGYNSSIMVVDEGIDIVASKNGQYFHIQVKTANGDDTKPYTTTIKKESFQHSAQTFYIIVMRRRLKQRYINDYLILSSLEIRRKLTSGNHSNLQSIPLRLHVNNERYYLNDEDVTRFINDFDIIG